MEFGNGSAPVERSWSETLSGLSLAEARSKARIYQQEAGRKRGPWTAAPMPGSWLEGVRAVGIFSPRADWDEPQDFSLPAHIDTAYPLMSGQKIEFRLARLNELRPHGTYNIMEPSQTARAVQPQLLLVPGLLMDRLGRRVGRGGGYYDRFLSENPDIRTVGVLHSDYLLDRMPNAWLHAGDRSVAAILTQSFHFELQTRRNPS